MTFAWAWSVSVHNSDSSENSNILQWQNSSWGSHVFLSEVTHVGKKAQVISETTDRVMTMNFNNRDNRHTPGWDDGWVRIETSHDAVPLPAGRDLRFDRPCKVKRFLARADRSEPRLAEASARRGEEDRAAVKAAGRKWWRVRGTAGKRICHEKESFCLWRSGPYMLFMLY